MRTPNIRMLKILVFVVGAFTHGTGFAQSMICNQSKIASMSYHSVNIPNKEKFSTSKVDIDKNLTVFDVNKDMILMKVLHCPDKEQGIRKESLDIVRKGDREMFEAVRRKNNRTEVYYLDFNNKFVMFSIISHSNVLLGGGGVAGVMFCNSPYDPSKKMSSYCTHKKE